jgi:hypothetical protein
MTAIALIGDLAPTRPAFDGERSRDPRCAAWPTCCVALTPLSRAPGRDGDPVVRRALKAPQRTVRSHSDAKLRRW